MKRTENEALKWLYQVPGKKKRIVVILSVLSFLNGLTGVATAILLKMIVDSAVAGDVQAFLRTVLLMTLLVLGGQGIQAVIRWLNELGRASFENTFKQRLTENILRRSYAEISAVHSGEWMNRLTSDTKIVADGYIEILPELIWMTVRLCGALVMIVVLDLRFALLIVLGGMILIIITCIYRKKLKLLHKDIQEKDGRLRIFLQERIASLMMIKSYAAEEQTIAGAAEKMENHKDARMRRNRFSNLCNIGYGIGMQGIFFLGVCYCAWGILKGSVSYGTLAAVMELVNQIRSPFANISGYLPRYYAVLASAERLMEAEAFPEDGNGDVLSGEKIKELYCEKLESVSLQNVDYSYYPVVTDRNGFNKEQSPVVLRNLSLEIRKGEYLAFTGHSGCGKSTVLKLLMCMYPPDSGTLTIKEKDGNILPLTASYRRLFAYVPQGNQLMNGTIRDIVSFADEGGTDERRMNEALHIACADEFVSELKDGVGTLLGERGTGLSEGQMQRIAIARALYSNAPVLLLDEATSSLDAATEEKLLFNLRKLTDKTVIIVTHRPAALQICDRVLQFTEDSVRKIEK